jgi:hypothetical protein
MLTCWHPLSPSLYPFLWPTEDPEGDDSDSNSVLSGSSDDERSGSDDNSDEDDVNSLKDRPEEGQKQQKSWVSSVRALLGLGRGEADRKGKGRASYQPVDGGAAGRG